MEADFGEVAVLRGQLVTLVVLVAVVVLRQGGAPDRRLRRPGCLLRRARARLPCARRGPGSQVRYDNLNFAVARVLGFSLQPVETERWTAFRSPFGDLVGEAEQRVEDVVGTRLPTTTLPTHPAAVVATECPVLGLRLRWRWYADTALISELELAGPTLPGRTHPAQPR